MEVKVVQEVGWLLVGVPRPTNTPQELHHPVLLSATPSGMPLGGSHNLHLEILKGTDETLDAPDFMSGGADLREVLDMSAAMERSRGI